MEICLALTVSQLHQGHLGLGVLRPVPQMGSRAGVRGGGAIRVVVSLVTLVCFRHTWRGKVHCISLLRDQGSVSNRELGQIFTVNSHIMQTQLNLRSRCKFHNAACKQSGIEASDIGAQQPSVL